MAGSLALWEVDPLFPAAEEVQNSSERMESIFRAWKFSQSVAGAQSAAAAAADANKRDLVTALDTVKWQVEEFAKAAAQVATASSDQQVRSRHSQFVRAMLSQVSNVEKELGGDLFARYRNKSYAAINTQEAESDCLASFLSGGRDLELDDDREEQQQELEEEKEEDEEEEEEEDPNACVSIRIDMIEEPSSNGFHKESMVEDCSASSSSSSSSSSQDWKFWRGRSHHPAFRLLKRWKGLIASVVSSGHELVEEVRLRFGGIDELRVCAQGRNGGRKVNPKVEVCNGSRLAGIERRLQRASNNHQSIPFGNAVQITVGAVLVVGFMGLYFWFLSTLVPYDHQPVPGMM